MENFCQTLFFNSNRKDNLDFFATFITKDWVIWEIDIIKQKKKNHYIVFLGLGMDTDNNTATGDNCKIHKTLVSTSKSSNLKFLFILFNDALLYTNGTIIKHLIQQSKTVYFLRFVKKWKCHFENWLRETIFYVIKTCKS